MKTYTFLFLLILGISCQDPKTTQEKLAIILASERYCVTLIESNGNITGRPSQKETGEKFEVLNEGGKLRVEYIMPIFDTDSTFKMELNEVEKDSLITILEQAIQSHDPNKEYGGCCVCSNLDFLISNDEFKVEIKPTGDTEFRLQWLLVELKQRKNKSEI